MRKRIIYILILLLLFSYNTIGAFEYHEEISSIEYLLNERIKIMNGFLYGDKDIINMNDIKQQLSNIEAEKLLINDVDILCKVIDNPTDYELALSVKVEKINSLEKTEEGIFINVDLNWSMRGYDGDFNMIKNYDLKCIETDEQMYLSSLKYIK